MRKVAVIFLFTLVLGIGFGVSQAQAITFDFIVNSAICRTGNSVDINVSANTYVPGVLLQVVQNGSLTVNEVRNHSGLLGWDSGPRGLDGSQTFTKTVTVYNGTTTGSGVADQSTYTLNCTDRVDGENALITVCHLGEACITYNAKTPTGEPASINEDPDGDGISGGRDNCPHDYNPDQEDGWGSAMGDLCDTEWYNRTGIGLAGFPQKDRTFNLHGNCIYLADGAPRCPVIASFDPAAFTPDMMPLHIETSDAGIMSVVVHFLDSNGDPAVYQVNTYSTNPPQPDTLLDDRLEIHVYSDGSWQWHMRGGDTTYNGN